jgi:hypothetical protein
MDTGEESLEILWDGLLSREPVQVQAAYATLNEEEKRAVLAHLNRMSTEEGWHPEQRLSALLALQALSGNP